MTRSSSSLRTPMVIERRRGSSSVHGHRGRTLLVVYFPRCGATRTTWMRMRGYSLKEFKSDSLKVTNGGSRNRYPFVDHKAGGEALHVCEYDPLGLSE